MKDLTKGPVGGHVVSLAAFIALTMLFQTLYFLADLYFVGRLGKEAVAGVGLAGNLMFIVLALTQSMSVGTTAIMSQSLGRKDGAQAQLVFNQAMALSILTGVLFGVVFFALRGAYANRLAADAATAELGVQYLSWFVPALFLQFPLVIMGAALRAMGDMKRPTVIQVATVLVNIALAPVLMFGWGTGRPLGVAGAAIASLIAIGLACVAFLLYFRRPSSPMRFVLGDWTPQPRRWGAILRIGVPAGGEFALVSVYMVLVYDIIRPFGAAAQAGFGIGMRVVQALFLPTVAIAFAAAPVAGQNYGAGLGPRVRQTFYSAATMSGAIMLALTLLCEITPAGMIRFFNGDPGVVAFGSEYLRIVCWNFLASGIVFVSSSVFQGMGNTLPPLGASALRILLFALPAYAIARQPGFQVRHLWYVSVASVTIQLVVNLWLLHREFGRKLPRVAAPATQAAAATMLTVALFGFSQTAAAQPAGKRAEVLVLGVYHMANPGRDIFNMQADDVLSAPRQAEIAELMAALKKFQPTTIAVEAALGEDVVPKRYVDYLAGTHALSRNETEQIGFRLAKEMGHKSIQPVDVEGDFPFQRVVDYAKATGQSAKLDALMAEIGEMVKAQGEYLKTHTVLQTLLYMNSDEKVAQDVGFYYLEARYGEPGDYAGPDLLAEWYRRNVRIFSNIIQLVKSPDDRVLVIYGAGHLGWLRHAVASDPTLRLRKLDEFAGPPSFSR